MSSNVSEKTVPVAVKAGPNPIQAFQEEMNNLFRNFFGGSLPHWWQASEMRMPFGVSPATDVIETDQDYTITAELPGMAAQDIAITISEDFVTIKGEKKAMSKEERNGYVRQERSYGEFQRVVALPANFANTEKAEATMAKGILTITVPKKVGVQPKQRRLEIKQVA